MSNRQQITWPRALMIKIIAAWILGLLCSLLIIAIYFASEPTSNLLIFVVQHPATFLISTTIISALLLIALGLTNRLVWPTAISFNLVLILLAINAVKMKSRALPLLPEDFGLLFEASQVAQVTPTLIIILSLSGLVVTTSLAIIAQNYLRRRYQINQTPSRIRALMIIGSCLIYLALGSLQTWLKQPNWYFQVNPLLGSRILTWNQNLNFINNGPIIGFFYNLGRPAISKPADYSETRIKEIINKYQADFVAATKNAQRPDIIFILSESFTDPLLFGDYYPLRRDPIPFTRKLLNSQQATWLNVSEYGGGTANVEFEALTGLTSVFDFGTSFYNTSLAKRDQFPSLVSRLRRQGYQTNAMHAYHGEMYKRYLVYPNLGFNRFIDLAQLKQKQTLERNKYISDQALFQELLDNLALSEQPSFYFLTTMQNHIPYNAIYNISERYQVQDQEEKNWYLENYLRGLEYSDQALAQLIEVLQQRSRPTILFFWGDHLPGDGVFQMVRDQNPTLAQKTPFLVYANYELPNSTSRLPELSPNYISDQLLSYLEWPRSGFEKLVQQVRQTAPMLTVLSRQDIKDPTIQAMLEDYRLIEYDLLAGQAFSIKQHFFEIHD